MWINFWDDKNVEWVSLDEFMAEPDWVMPLWQIPTNVNNPYTEEKVRPLYNYEDEEKVAGFYIENEENALTSNEEEDKTLNPCAVIPLEKTKKEIRDLPVQKIVDNKIVVFHNGKGPMCLEFLEFIKTIDYKVEQHLVVDENYAETLISYQNKFTKSEGVSESFGYYPIIFINDQVFSGFNELIKAEIIKEIAK